MKHNEDNLQAACVKWFRLQYPDYLIYAVPKGGFRNVIEAARMKRCGVTAGVPDLTVVLPNETVWIELKVKGGRVSNNQNQIISKLQRLNRQVYVCWDLDDFINTIQNLT